MRLPRGRSIALLTAFATLLVVIGPLPVAQGPQPASATTPPNIVIFLTDDQRADELSTATNPLAVMPTVQSQLQEKGVTFDNGFVTDSLCCPSRISILRGQYSHTTRIYGISGPNGGASAVKKFGLEQSTLPVWLQGAGYRTAMIGKYLNGYGNASYVPPGWDYWRGMVKGDGNGYFNYYVSENGSPVWYPSGRQANYSTTVFTNYAQQFITGAPSNQPLFLYLSYRAPHLPIIPAQIYKSDPRCNGIRTDGEPSFNESDVSDKPPYVANIPPFDSTTASRSGLFRPKRACRTLLSVDDSISTLLNLLQSTGRLSNTLIIFTSDNGLLYGEHRWDSKKKVPYEESIRVPFIVRYDPMTSTMQGTVDHRFVLNIDIAPTAAAAAGAAIPNPVPCRSPCVPKPVDGLNILPILGQPSATWRTDFLIEADDPPSQIGNSGYTPPYCGVRTSGYVFVHYSGGFEELYNLNTDPYQLTNLLYQNSDPSITSLRNQLYTRLQTLCDPTPPDFSW